MRTHALTESAHGVNEHRVACMPGVEHYALVIFEDFEPIAALVFPYDLSAINSALSKRAPDVGSVLQFTRANYLAIMADPARFRGLGMLIWHQLQDD